MIPYQKRQWTSHLFDIQGSMVREIMGRVLACVLWSAVVVSPIGSTRVAISPTVHTLVGAALGLLLVFRTNASYDRFWEGRRQWGAIINESRNLGRAAPAVRAPRRPDLARRRVLAGRSAFAYAAMNRLRGTATASARPRGLLPADEVAPRWRRGTSPWPSPPGSAEHLAQARDRGADLRLRPGDARPQRPATDRLLGACERIRKTPLPFVYVVHLRRALILYCFTLPFALVDALRLVDGPRHAPGRLHLLRHRGDRRRDREPVRPRRQRPAPRAVLPDDRRRAHRAVADRPRRRPRPRPRPRQREHRRAFRRWRSASGPGRPRLIGQALARTAATPASAPRRGPGPPAFARGSG